MKRPLNRLSTKQLEQRFALLGQDALFSAEYVEVRDILERRGALCKCGYPCHPCVPCEELGPQARIQKEFKVSQDEMDDIYEFCDDCFRKGDFRKVDALLEELTPKVQFMPPDVVFCYLTVTLCAQSKLPSRVKFYQEAESIYRPDLLQGLRV